METEQSREGGEVRGLNPDNGRATHNVIILLKIIMGISNATMKSREKVLQKEIKTRGRKISQEDTVTNPDKKKSAPNEI